MTAVCTIQPVYAQVDTSDRFHHTIGDLMDQEQFTAYLALQGLSDATIRNYRAMFARWCDWAITAGRDPMAPDPPAVRAFATGCPAHAPFAPTHGPRSHTCAEPSTWTTSPQRSHSPASHAASPVASPPSTPSRSKRTVPASPDLPSSSASTPPPAAPRSHRSLGGVSTSKAGTVTLDRPKARDLHTVPLHPELGRVLADRRIPGETWVFPDRHGGHVSPATVWAWVLEVAERADLGRVTPHILRHTCLTIANDATGDLRAVQDLAGHTDPAVTARYTRASTTALTQAVAALDYGA